MIALALLAAFGGSEIVSGLRAGEQVVVLDADERVTTNEDYAELRPRVLNANTAEPLEGVRVEAWNENGAQPLYVETLLGVAVTGRDGGVRLRVQGPAELVEKVRLSKPGFASRTVSRSDALDEVIQLFPALPLVGRVLDLEGHPVAGAIVRTRETCAHAVPAAQTQTDAFGRFRLEDCPAEAGGPELEVICRDHEPLYRLDLSTLRESAAPNGEIELRAGRRASSTLQIVGPDGSPLAHRRVMRSFAPVAEAWTDDGGTCSFPPALDTSESGLKLCDGLGEEVLFAPEFPSGSTVRLSTFSFDSDAARFSGRLRVELTGPEAGEATVEILDALGHEQGGEAREYHVAPGPCRVWVGRPFSYWREIVREIDVGDDPVSVSLEVRREPQLTLRIPPAGWLRWTVQAGQASRTESGALETGERIVVSAPPGRELIVFTESDSGEQRLARVPPVETDTEVDLTVPATLVRPPRPQREPVVVRFLVKDRTGRSLEGVRGTLYAPIVDREATTGADGLFEQALGAGAPYSVSFALDRFESARIEGLVPDHDDGRPIPVTLARSAALELRGDLTAVDVCGVPVEPASGGFDLFHIAPGPLSLRIARRTGPPLALELVLDDGESRRIEVH